MDLTLFNKVPLTLNTFYLKVKKGCFFYCTAFSVYPSSMKKDLQLDYSERKIGTTAL